MARRAAQSVTRVLVFSSIRAVSQSGISGAIAAFVRRFEPRHLDGSSLEEIPDTIRHMDVLRVLRKSYEGNQRFFSAVLDRATAQLEKKPWNWSESMCSVNIIQLLNSAGYQGGSVGRRLKYGLTVNGGFIIH